MIHKMAEDIDENLERELPYEQRFGKKLFEKQINLISRAKSLNELGNSSKKLTDGSIFIDINNSYESINVYGLTSLAQTPYNLIQLIHYRPDAPRPQLDEDKEYRIAVPLVTDRDIAQQYYKNSSLEEPNLKNCRTDYYINKDGNIIKTFFIDNWIKTELPQISVATRLGRLVQSEMIPADYEIIEGALREIEKILVKLESPESENQE